MRRARPSRPLIRAAALVLLAAASPTAAGDKPPAAREEGHNAYAFIPPQCYTRTKDAAGGVHNPCYTCHVNGPAPNFVKDADLQLAYDFPGAANENPWTNLFVDRRAAVAAMPDDETLAYVRTGNYLAPDGRPALAAWLANPPAAYDVNGDGLWSGYRPDIFFRFDEAGYDLGRDGRRTGWRSYGYMPLPGAFWPTNGSADDVAIRLAPAFRQNAAGAPDWDVYAANLAIVEALMKREDVAVPPLDERSLGVDLDRDGRLGTARRVVFAFDPRAGISMTYAGRAGDELAAGRVHLAAGLLPEGTEFVHSLRYLDVTAAGTVEPAARLKELRYARKTSWRSYMSLLDQAMDELREEHDDPDRPETFLGDVETGISTGQGWRFQGFIEDASGALRPQSMEESVSCAGCHAGVGRTLDNNFSFGRKITDERTFGWYRWDRTHPLRDLPDGRRVDGRGEYATYLAQNGAGDEFRANDEARARFFPQGERDEDAFAELRRRVGPLVEPSPSRALALDKAYRLIVAEQSFARGRQPVLAPLDATVWRSVEPGTPTGVGTPFE